MFAQLLRFYSLQGHPDGHYRKETVVLNDKKPFDIPGIGKFETAVVQEGEYMDDVLTQRVTSVKLVEIRD